jgi:hypothetical protein
MQHLPAHLKHTGSYDFEKMFFGTGIESATFYELLGVQQEATTEEVRQCLPLVRKKTAAIFQKKKKQNKKEGRRKGGRTTQGSHKPAMAVGKWPRGIEDQLVLQAPCRPIYRPEATRKKLLPAGVQPLPIVPVNE